MQCVREHAVLTVTRSVFATGVVILGILFSGRAGLAGVADDFIILRALDRCGVGGT